jgi:RNA polymerase sigma-70 factor (ECF subfamily)
MRVWATEPHPAVTADSDFIGDAADLRVVLADEAAFRRWYEHHVPAVYSYLASRCLGDADLVQDLTQQTFIAAIDARRRFDGRSEVSTWLCGIARHKLADHFRRLEREEARRRRATVRALELDIEGHAWRGADDRVLIAEAMRALPAAQRAVLTFVAIDDLPVAEVARLIGRSFGATQSLLARARESFRRAYPPEADR